MFVFTSTNKAICAVYANASSFPTSASNGRLAYDRDAELLYIYNSDTSAWDLVSGLGSGESVTVSDSTSINLTKSLGAISAELILSADVASADHQLISLTLESDGLKAELSNADILAAVQSALDLKADASALTDHLNDSADAHDASAISVVAISGVTGSDAQAVLEDLKTQIDLKLESSDLSVIEGNISDIQADITAIQSDILAIKQEATSVADSNSIDFSLTGNQISGDLKLSAASAETGKIKAGLDIQSDGLRAQINKSDIEGVIDLYENIDNANIASNAAIALSKLATVTASKVLVSDSSGNISASLVSDTSLGYLDATSSIQTQLDDKRSISNNIVTVSGTTRTLELSDAWKYLRVTANATVTITIPLNASVAFPVGTEIEFFQVGTGPVNFEPEEGVSGYPFSIADQYQQVKIKKIDTDSWDIFGSVAVI